MNLRAAAVAITTLLAGIALALYGTGPLRGLGGDVGVVVLGVAGLAAVRLGTPARRVGGMLALAVAVEAFQGLELVGPDAHWLLHMTIGSTFDPLDLVAYAAGGALAGLGERFVWPSRGSQP